MLILGGSSHSSYLYKSRGYGVYLTYMENFALASFYNFSLFLRQTRAREAELGTVSVWPQLSSGLLGRGEIDFGEVNILPLSIVVFSDIFHPG
jgi:hypothetical protein